MATHKLRVGQKVELVPTLLERQPNTVGQQDLTAQPGTSCQIEFRLIHMNESSRKACCVASKSFNRTRLYDRQGPSGLRSRSAHEVIE
jgi:hypothetical protein